MDFVGDYASAHSQIAHRSRRGIARDALGGENYHGVRGDVPDNLHPVAYRETKRVVEGVEKGRRRRRRIGGPDSYRLGLKDVDRRAVLLFERRHDGGEVAEEYVARIVIGDAVGDGVSEDHLPDFAAGVSVHDERCPALAEADEYLRIDACEGDIALVVVVRKARHRHGIHIAQQCDGFRPQSLPHEGGDALLHGVGLRGHAIMCGDCNGRSGVQVVLVSFAVGFAVYF